MKTTLARLTVINIALALLAPSELIAETCGAAQLAPPSAPTQFSQRRLPSGTNLLQWVDSNGEFEYVVTRSDSQSGPFVPVASASCNVTSVEDTTAVPGTTYFYQVIGMNDLGEATSAVAVTGDANFDGIVNIIDVNIVSASWDN